MNNHQLGVQGATAKYENNGTFGDILLYIPSSLVGLHTVVVVVVFLTAGYIIFAITICAYTL